MRYCLRQIYVYVAFFSSSLLLTLEGVIGVPTCWAVHQFPPSVMVVCQCLDLCEWFLHPFLDIIIPLFLLSSPPPMTHHDSLKICLCKAIWLCHMAIPFQLSFLHCREKVFMSINVLLDFTVYLVIGDVFKVWDAQDVAYILWISILNKIFVCILHNKIWHLK